MLLNVFNALFLTAYLLSAAVQYNDPDAPVWIAIYLAAAAICINHFRRSGPNWLPPLLLVISLAWIGVLLPAIIGHVTLAEIFDSISMKTRAVEEAREIGGLMFVALWAGILTYYRYRNSS